MWTPMFDVQMFPPSEALLVIRFDGASSIVGNDLDVANVGGIPTGRIDNVGILVYRLYVPQSANVGGPDTAWRLFVLKDYDRAHPDLAHPFGGYDVQTKAWNETFCPKVVHHGDPNGGHIFMASIPHDDVTLPRNFTLAIVSEGDFKQYASGGNVKIHGFGGLSNWIY